MIAILLGLIYLRTDVNQTGVMNFNGVLFLLIMNMVMTNVFAVANVSTFFRDHYLSNVCAVNTQENAVLLRVNLV